jgi:hypothetical protein
MLLQRLRPWNLALFLPREVREMAVDIVSRIGTAALLMTPFWGIGKTHLAVAIGREATGQTVLA